MKPIFSALGLVATGSLIYLFKNYISDNQTIIEKQILKEILISLRKRFFSSLRQIAFVVNNIRANECDFEPKKISDIIMKDGGSGDAKLNLIQSITLQTYNITRQSFQASCNYYKQNDDYQIRVLIKNLTMDIELALKGNIESYNGPTINISPQKVINIYREILKRRMENIKAKLVTQASNEQILQRQFLIQEYLEMEGIKHDKESNQKIFIAILEKHYREDSDFRIQFENLQIQMQDFIQQIQKEHKQKLKKSYKSKDFGQQVLKN